MRIAELVSLTEDEFLREAYRLVLGRDIDIAGLEWYSRKLAGGRSKEAVLVELSRSDEAIARLSPATLPELGDEAFIDSTYVRLLGRNADAGGMRAYLTQLRKCGDRMRIVQDIAGSAEARRYDPTGWVFRREMNELILRETSFLGWRKLIPRRSFGLPQHGAKRGLSGDDLEVFSQAILQAQRAEKSTLIDQIKLLTAALEGVSNAQRGQRPVHRTAQISPMARSTSGKRESVSIVIATAGRATSLDRTLCSLRQLRYPHFEVVVVLGPSPDDSAAIVARHANFVRHYTIDRLNLSAARNVGLAHSRGDIVAFIDDDAIPEPDWLDRLVAGYGEPDVAQVGGFIRDNRGYDYQSKYLVVDRFGDSQGFEELPADLDQNRYLGLTGTNFSARRDLLMQIGGFDEEYAYFLDETDVTVRLIDQGWQSRVIPDAEIHHKYEPSHLRTVSRVPKSMYATARSKAYFCCVHGGKQKPLQEVFDYLGDFIRKERGWKSDLLHHGLAEKKTVERLIEEVERGVRDGVKDAFFYTDPQGISNDLLAASQVANFQQFPLPLPATERLRICFLSQDYPPVGSGGIGQWTHEMAAGLARRGHEVTVICRSEADYSHIDFVDGIWVHRIVAQAGGPSEADDEGVPLALLSYSSSAEAEIRRIQPRRQFDVICGPIFDLEPLVALRRSGIPTVVSLQTTYKLALPHKPDWLADEWYRKSHVDKVIAKERELLATAPFILANTPALVADLEDAYSLSLPVDRVEIISHGVEDIASGVAPFPEKPGVVRLLFVGRLEMRKGADILLEALPQLLRDHPVLEVDIVGDDSQVIEGKTLRRRFEERWQKERFDAKRVTFHGIIAREELLRHYASCDLFVAPSRYESFGLIYVEAMTFSKPVVGLAVGGVVDVVEDGVNGLLIDKADPVLLREALGNLIRDPQLRKALGKSGREIYERKFHVDRMVSGIEKYFSKIKEGVSD